MVSGPSGSRGMRRTRISPSVRARSRSARENGTRATARVARRPSGRRADRSRARCSQLGRAEHGSCRARPSRPRALRWSSHDVIPRSGTSVGRRSYARSRDDGRSACARPRAAGCRRPRRIPPPPRSAARTSSSSSFRRQRWKRPSAVRRMRLHVPQYGSVTGLMKPITPRAPAPGSCATRRTDRAARGAGAGRARPRSGARTRADGTSPSRAVRAVSPLPNGIVSMKRTCQARSSVSAASGTTSSSLKPRDDHGVQLDRREAGRLGGLDARPDLGERAPAHDAREPLGIEAVEVDVQRGGAPRGGAARPAPAAGRRWSSARGRGGRACAASRADDRRAGRRAAWARRRSGGSSGSRPRPPRAPPARSRRR